jgi:hypothetical protein
MKRLIFLLLVLLCLPLAVQANPKRVLTPEVPGDGVDNDGDNTVDESPATAIVEDAEVSGAFHAHFMDCDKVNFENVADVTFPDEIRVQPTAGSTFYNAQMLCYAPSVAAATYKIHLFYSSPAGARAVWLSSSVMGTPQNNVATILPATNTPQWQQVILTGSNANFRDRVNGGSAQTIVHAGGALQLWVKAEGDVRFACAYLTTSDAPTLTCPDEGPVDPPLLADYEMLELGSASVPTAWNSAAFDNANELQFAGTVSGSPATCTVKALWHDTTTDRMYFSINCADTDDETVHVANDSASMPAGDEDRVDIRWRGDLTQTFDTDTYMVIGNLTPVYFDADWSGVSNARNSAVNLNTTVVKNVVASTSWNLFIAVDIGSNITADTIGLFNAAVVDKDSGVANAIRYFHGTGLTSMAQWGTVKWSATEVVVDADVTAPVVTNQDIPVGTVEQTSFIMTADTSEAGTCRMRVGAVTSGQYELTPVTSGQSINGACSVAKTNLVAGITYYAVIDVIDAAGNIGTSGEESVMTDAPDPPQNCTHFASPTGTGNGLTVSTPYKISNFTQSTHAAPNAVLCLADGTYTGIEGMIQPTAGKNGNNLAPITVKALNDGDVFINGQTARRPINLVDNDFWVIEGINVGNSGPLNVISPVIHVQKGSSDNTFRRVCAWNAAPGTNSAIWQLSGPNTLVEDSCAFGTGRKGFTNSQGGNDVTVRRSFAIWKSHDYTGPNMPFSNVYDSYGAIFENNIAMWNGADNGAPNQPYGCYAQDGFDNSTNHESNSKYLASLCILRSTDTVPTAATFGGIMGARTVNLTEYRDMIIYNDPGSHPLVKPILAQIYDNHTGSNQCSTTPAGVCNRTLTNITSVGFDALQSVNAATWTTSNIRDYDNAAAMNAAGHNPFQTTGTNGARMCYRTVDGVLQTGTKLWPWPMQQRIIDAMTLASETPIDVMDVIEDRFGTIPAGCTD